MLDVIIREMTEADIESVRKVGQRTWSDVATRDVGHKVRYPLRPREIVRAYMWKEPKGCLVAERKGEVVASAFCHAWGRVGWVGPFEVLPEMQNQGIGTSLMHRCEDFLASRGCSVLGLETMPYFMRNLHFYLRLGYVPGELTFITENRELSLEEGAGVEELEHPMGDALSSSITRLSNSLAPGLDYSREFEMTLKMSVGRCFVLRRGKVLQGAAIVHDYYPKGEADHASLRLLLVNPRIKEMREAFLALLDACENAVKEEGRKRLFARFSASHPLLYDELRERSYRLEGTNIRLVKGRYHEKGGYHLSAWAG